MVVFRTFGASSRDGPPSPSKFYRLQDSRTSGDFGWAILGLMVSIVRKV